MKYYRYTYKAFPDTQDYIVEVNENKKIVRSWNNGCWRKRSGDAIFDFDADPGPNWEKLPAGDVFMILL